jgi:hypothetical protein
MRWSFETEIEPVGDASRRARPFEDRGHELGGAQQQDPVVPGPTEGPKSLGALNHGASDGGSANEASRRWTVE